MSEKHGLPEDTASASRSRRPSKDTLNLVIAACAVLISAASFVAAYMQSDAAYRQVKAETWPFLQIASGNVEDDSPGRVVYVKLMNAGVGPAQVESLVVSYRGKPVKSFWQLSEACCKDDSGVNFGGVDPRTLQVVTGSVVRRILPAGEKGLMFRLPEDGTEQAYWDRVDIARRELTFSGCYCSLLDECFETDFLNDPVEVKACKLTPDLDFQG